MKRKQLQILPENLDALPKFQQLQYQFAAHLRDPQGVSYDNAAVRSEAPIEKRRLAVYESLFFNNLQDFLSGLFPVLKSILGDADWNALVRDFMRAHRAQTPLFHELGQEFLLFLQQNDLPEKRNFPYLFELAHYEWVELALAIEEAEGLDGRKAEKVDLQKRYRLSSLAWLLAYEWPVHQIRGQQPVPEKPDQITTLLAYRDASQSLEPIEFMVLTPALFQLLQFMNIPEDGDRSAKAWLSEQSRQSGRPIPELEALLSPALQGLLDRNLIAS